MELGRVRSEDGRHRAPCALLVCSCAVACRSPPPQPLFTSTTCSLPVSAALETSTSRPWILSTLPPLATLPISASTPSPCAPPPYPQLPCSKGHRPRGRPLRAPRERPSFMWSSSDRRVCRRSGAQHHSPLREGCFALWPSSPMPRHRLCRACRRPRQARPRSNRGRAARRLPVTTPHVGWGSFSDQNPRPPTLHPPTETRPHVASNRGCQRKSCLRSVRLDTPQGSRSRG